MPAVEIRGNVDLRKALREFTPDLEKAMKDEITRGLSPIVKQAQSFVPNQPMRNWFGGSNKKITAKSSMFRVGKFPLFIPAVVKQGIKLSTATTNRNRNGFTAQARIINGSAAGAIYETAGRKNPNGQPWVGRNGGKSHKESHSNNPTAGQQFITNLGALTKSDKGDGRLIYRAWAENQGVGLGIAMKAISDAKIKLYERNSRAPFQRAA
jgi:hypothetical protein